MGTLSKFTKPCEGIENESRRFFCKFIQNALIYYLYENSIKFDWEHVSKVFLIVLKVLNFGRVPLDRAFYMFQMGNVFGNYLSLELIHV